MSRVRVGSSLFFLAAVTSCGGSIFPAGDGKTPVEDRRVDERPPGSSGCGEHDSMEQGVYVDGPSVLNHVQAAADAVCLHTGACKPSTYNGHHPTSSRALDILAANAYGQYASDGNALGDATAKFLLLNQEKYGVWYVIWRQRINYGNGWTGMEDRGSITQNHYDHVHVSFNTTAPLTGPDQTGGGQPVPVQCMSDTLGFHVDKGVCVQSRFYETWFQCSSTGEWVDAPNANTDGTGPEGPCTELHPLDTPSPDAGAPDAGTTILDAGSTALDAGQTPCP